MIELEVFGAGNAPGAPPVAEIRRLCSLVCDRLEIAEGHLAIEFVDPQRMSELNGRFRDRYEPTDVLSFPIDGAEPLPLASAGAGNRSPVAGAQPPRELGDIVICPEHTADLREAIVHGVLHLLGMDHETDHGEMLALQVELLTRAE